MIQETKLVETESESESESGSGFEFGFESASGWGKQANADTGSVDFILILVPILIISITLFGLFQYGLAVNTLTHKAILIGRQLARFPEADNLERLTESELSALDVEVSDFHVMRYTLGNRVFIQLVLVGKTILSGITNVTPSGKSLTPVDNWN